MNDHLRAVQSLLLDALEIEDARERAAFLARSCGADLSLRKEVEGLITAEASAGQFLPDHPSTGAAEAAWAGAAEELGAASAPIQSAMVEQAGDRVGRYKLLQRIGEGGCGLVYMAEQETPVRRRVALKIIKLGMDTRNVVARFEAERQALALMDHPNIAKVLDAGATETGRPYFVMELVRGVKITRYCDEQRSSMRQRLELFIQVCQAVQHAHQKGIIHRDLKPSNILVTERDGQPVPKVIDFGIAKATGDLRLTDKTLFTAFEQFIGTPAYMSPEQARLGELDIDTRSDIYSLGVLLYELLTGKTPFETQALLAAGLDEMRRTIREKQPVRPSTRLTTMAEAELTATAGFRGVEAAKLVHAVRGDLDWVIMKCLEKDRTRRYASANGLGTDIRRHLNNEPVVARPPSKLYEFQKTVRRHKVGFAAAAAVIVVLALGVVATSWQAIRATRSEREQTRFRHQAEAAEREQTRLRQQAEAESYTSDMNLAKQAWDEGNLRRAQVLLRSHIPQPGEPDLRGFEWRYLWNLFERDESFKTIPTTNDPVNLLASSPSHGFVVACCEKTIRLLDPTTGNELHRFPHPNSRVTNVCYALALASKATNLMAMHRADGVVTLWDLDRREVRLSFQAMFTNLAALPSSQLDKFLALSPDGKFLAVGSPATDGAELILWDISTTPQLPPRALWTNEVTNGFTSLAFSPDGHTLIGAESFRGRTLRTWDVMTGTEGKPFQNAASGNIRALAVSPDGSLVAHAGLEARIHVLDFATRTWKYALDGHSGDVQSLTFSPDGHRLVSSGADGTVRIWEVASQKLVGLWRDPHGLEVHSAAFTPNGSSIFSASSDEVRIWNADSRPPETTIETRQDWGWPVISADGKWLVTSDSINSKDSAEWPGAKVWDIATGQQRLYLADKGRHPLAMAFSPNAGLFAVADLEKQGVVGLWNTTEWETASSPAQAFRYLTNGFETGSISFSLDGKILAAAGLEFVSSSPSGATNRLAFWEVASWKKLNLLPEAGVGATERAAAASVAFSSNGRLLAIGHRDGWVRLWDFKQGRKLREFKAHENSHFAGAVVRFSSDDRWLVSILMGRNSLALFDVANLERGPVLSVSDPAPIWWATFAPDNKSLVTADNDGLVKFWNLRTLRVALTLRHSYGAGGFLAFAPDGNLLASEDGKGTVKLWRASPLEEIESNRWGR